MIVALVLFLPSCYQQSSVSSTGLIEPYRICDVNVPFADNINTSQFDKVSEQEEDSFGRRYFSYYTYSVMLQEDIEIHVISQKTEDGKVYYCPDVCYMIRYVKDEAFSDTDIEQFKTRNDWNSPFDTDKMNSVLSTEAHQDVVSAQTLEQDILGYLGLEDTHRVLTNGLEVYGDTTQLFIACVFVQNAGTVEDHYYVVAYRSDAEDPILACQEISKTLECQSVIRNFRDTWF